MNQSKKNPLLVTLLLLSLIFGIGTTYINYNNYIWHFPASLFLYMLYLASCLATVFFSFRAKIYLKTFNAKQNLFIGLMLLMFLGGWVLVKQDWPYALFLYASVCFLISGLLILRSAPAIGKVLFIGAFIISIINVAPIFFFISEKSFITKDLIATLFISNRNEAGEYMASRLNYWHTIAVFIFIITVVFLFRLNKKNALSKLPLSVWALFFISFFTLSLSGPIGALTFGYISNVSQTKKLTQMIKERSQRLQEYKFAVHPDSTAAKKIVVIVGESLNRNYMGLYGYAKPTTPNLSALLQDSTSSYRLFKFENVVSPEVSTVPSLKKVLTNVSQRNPIPFENALTIVDYFNSAGYKTHWISNQVQLGESSTPITVISTTASQIYFSGLEDSTENGKSPIGTKYDETLLAPFEKYIAADSTGKEVYFVHLMGNHWNYDDRYPPKFNFFKEREKDDVSLYLNSVLYNDWVVSRIMEIAKEHGADAVIYFSDHSEILATGHNLEKFEPEMVEIPFMVYVSENYLHKNKGLENRLIANQNTPAMNDNFFHFIQDFTGVKSTLYDTTASFISPQYIRKKRIVNNNSYNYDK